MAYAAVDMSAARTGNLPNPFPGGWGGTPSVQNDLGKPTRPSAKVEKATSLNGTIGQDHATFLKGEVDTFGDKTVQAAAGGLSVASRYATVFALATAAGGGDGRSAEPNIWQTGMNGEMLAGTAQQAPDFMRAATDIMSDLLSSWNTSTSGDVERAAAGLYGHLENASVTQLAQLPTQLAEVAPQRSAAQGLNA